MGPSIRVERTSLPVTAAIREGRSAAPATPDVIPILDGREASVDCIIDLDVGGTKIRYELDGSFTGVPLLTVLVVEQTQRLFLGGRRLSCVVDLKLGVVDHAFEHCLFWGFDLATRPGFVLETGELDCLFRALDGRVLGRVPVDPPWEMSVEAEGLRFESGVVGAHLLPFPDGGAASNG